MYSYYFWALPSVAFAFGIKICVHSILGPLFNLSTDATEAVKLTFPPHKRVSKHVKIVGLCKTLQN